MEPDGLKNLKKILGGENTDDDYQCNKTHLNTFKLIRFSWGNGGVNLIVVRISQYIRISNHYILHLKLTQCYMPILFQ